MSLLRKSYAVDESILIKRKPKDEEDDEDDWDQDDWDEDSLWVAPYDFFFDE